MKKILFFIILMGALQIGFAKEPPSRPKPSNPTAVNFRSDCQPGNSSVDLDINNVRARLLSRGDFWWDYNDAKYIVPNVEAGSGQDEISSIYSGAVWMGGFDASGNLKIAASDYASNGNTDYYPGPLDPVTGETDASICALWDRHFEVRGSNITQFRAKWKQADAIGVRLDQSEIPEDMKYYPARGNPYFTSQPNGFILPDQDLASFRDENEDGIYDPLDGDYPVIEIRGCPDKNYADQMFFQIYNDNGGPHKTSKGNPIRMEVQVQAFAFATSDELNDMTFMRYKLINRAQDTISDCYFAMWVDADLGCSDDDFVGCDTTRSLAYYYNADDIDGNTNCSCSGGVTTYCTRIPLLGIDYFRGPLDENGAELGMSSFTYFNRKGTTPSPPPGTTDPETAAEYYNYLTGLWKDGSPYYGGDDGFQDPAFPIIKYAFPSVPDDVNGWSMAQEGIYPGDRRTVQASGPFVLEPGKTNELIIGLPWVPNVDYPAPDISKLLAADDLAQNLFDACFDITDGPDAPDVDVVELDREIIMTLNNNDFLSNNKQETYEEEDLVHADQFYHFEGYIIYQTASENVSLADLDNPDLARIVAQTDVKNGVSKIYNWEAYAKNPDPNNSIQLYRPVLMIDGHDEGVKHSFSFKKDQFASGDAKLINHRKYYYVAVAYAYNNFKPFDPDNPSAGQAKAFLAGRKTAYGSKIKPVTTIPRPSTYSLLNSRYGQGPVITRLSGSGTGGNFLAISKETRENSFVNTGGGRVTYLPGQAPFSVKVVNPLKVVEGKYRVVISDGTSGAAPHAIKDSTLFWVLEVLDGSGNVVNTIKSTRDLSYFNEEVLSEYGFSIELGQVEEPGSPANDNWGATGIQVEYADGDKPVWMITAKDNVGVYGSIAGEGLIDFMRNTTEYPEKAFVNAVDPAVSFYPFTMLNTEREDNDNPYFITPGWIDNKVGIAQQLDSIYHLNNVDIVMTSDKSKWSRCVVTEAANVHYGFAGVSIPDLKAVGNRKQFYLRDHRSVSKEMGSDGLPIPDDDGDGMGWFPGYAVDVETGKRLNIFFSENSTFREEETPFFYPADTSVAYQQMFGDAGLTGADMMFNPSPVQYLNNMGGVEGEPLFVPNVNSMYLGGQHFVYVTYDEYDECAYLRAELSQSQTTKRIKPLSHIQWAGLVMTAPNEKMLSYADGLIPNDVVVSIRVSKPYNTVESYLPITIGTEKVFYGELPVYEFELKGVSSQAVVAQEDKDNALDAVGVVPNPYYGYSYYERSQFTNIVKIINLPAKSTVSIYSLDGKFIRKFERDEIPYVDGDTGYARQISPDVEWDLKNASGIPVASGVYLIHVEAPGLGERIIKWYGMNRQFDPSGL